MRLDGIGTPYARDYAGYGRRGSTEFSWPRSARVALSFVLNYEEGSERTILNGDHESESLLTELPVQHPQRDARDLNVESLYDYGARVGVWRLLDIFADYSIPVTVFAVGMALEKNPQVAAAFVEENHEIASHHYRWVDYAPISEEVERSHLRKSVEVIRELTGRSPVGFYGGRVSVRSRRLAMETQEFIYDSDAYDDDIPYWVELDGKRILVIPYSLDSNDAKYLTMPGFVTSSDFLTYLSDTFDTLYREGAKSPRLMSVGLHCRISGRPGRALAVRRFLDYVLGFEDVWITTRASIAEHCVTRDDLNVVIATSR